MFRFITGPMGSGKTLYLLARILNEERQGRKVCLVKPIIDTKAGNSVETRFYKDQLDKTIQREVDILLTPRDNILEIIEKLRKVQTLHSIYCDEAQFLQPKQVEQFFHIAYRLHIQVFCYGLNTSSQQKLFPGSERLNALAKREEISDPGRCSSCGEPAQFTIRRENGVITFGGELIAIEGSSKNETYEAMCPECMLKNGGVPLE